MGIGSSKEDRKDIESVVGVGVGSSASGDGRYLHTTPDPDTAVTVQSRPM